MASSRLSFTGPDHFPPIGKMWSLSKMASTTTTKAPVDSETGTTTEIHVEQDKGLRRKLKARHLSMIALGGALGSGLLITTGATLAKGGPGGLLISYCVIGCIVALVLSAMGEMATWRPIASGFAGYGTAYVDPALGFALGYWHVDLVLFGCRAFVSDHVP